MSASHTANSTPVQNGRERPPAGKIVPAVPLSMSRPRRQTQAKTLKSDNVGLSGAHQPANAKHGRDVECGTITNSSIADAERDSQKVHSHSIENGVRSSSSQIAATVNGTASVISKPMTPDPSQDQDNTARTTPTEAGAARSGDALTPSSRQPPGILDMRSVENGSPSAFTPSTEQKTPNSTSSLRARRVEFPAPIPFHSSRPSASSIVFGSQDNTASSPTLRQSNDTPEALPPFYPPPAGHVPKTLSNHVQHVVVPQSTFPLHSIHSPPFTPFSQQRTGYQQPPAPPLNSRQPSYKSKPDVRHAVELPYTNGHQSRSDSGSSSVIPESLAPTSDPALETAKFIMPEGRRPFPKPTLGQRPIPPKFHQSQPAMPSPPPDYQANVENAEMMRDHVRSHFNNPDLADCHLQITDMHGGRRYLDSHKIILSRSPTLLMLIQNSEPPQSSAWKTQVHIHLSTDYVTLEAFSHGLRYLYGEPIMTSQRVMNAPRLARRMRLALEDAAVGVWLKAPVIAMSAIDIAATQMHWETISDALSFALEGGLSPLWLVEDIEDRSSTEPTDELNIKPETSGMPTYDPAASQLLHRIIDFTLHMFPPDFFLDISAPQLEAVQRLPRVPEPRESRQSIPDPRLSQIHFGEMGAHETRPSPITSLVSSMLLSMPFPILKVILEHPILTNRLGIDTVASIMRAVTVERESRRNRALNTVIAEHIDDYSPSTAVQNLHWAESVEVSTQNRVGFRLARRRKGIDTPPNFGGGQ
ncbi:hypothetical protein K431DRAFT_281543 [Polychaeton citri CBS 116435]|uniref:BTB domain-containing protein n=1 Tax=Polychaeton citri CBS 116435 TaxID=1314669 RepID=A0A9P4QFW0_9PEZI|nr:hypothetical protein K431DRAFT_281543 [Polychaeton citri CBS 116435]